MAKTPSKARETKPVSKAKPTKTVKDPSFTMNDFDQCLNDDGPAEDAPIKDFATAIRKWHNVLELVGKRKTRMAWRIGQALVDAQNKIPNGEWYKFLDQELPDISKTTIWRYIQLYSRSPNRAPTETLTDAYIDLGITTKGLDTVEEYCNSLRGLVTKIWKLMRTINGMQNQHGAMLVHIDYHDFADVDGKKLLEFEAGLNQAWYLLREAIIFNPSDNLFTRHGDAIGAQARLAVMENIGKSLDMPYAEYPNQPIGKECIPEELLDPETVQRWEDEHREMMKQQGRHERRRKAIVNYEKLQQSKW